ncbi:MAG: M48 family metalloprotease [Proteobacteria bacterium]|nr:M48 family metalloprotease [Pseudomonadota bacterium]
MKEEIEKLRIAFMKIMNCKEIKLFGALIYKFKTRIINDPDLTAFIYFNGKSPNIVFGRNLVKRQSINQLVYIMLHEMLHFINNHHTRGMKYDRVIANLAADHVVNDVLLRDLGGVEVEQDDGSVRVTQNIIGEVCKACDDPKPFVVEELMGKKNMTYEGVYEWLMDNKVQYKMMLSPQCSSCNGSGKDSNGKGCPDCDGTGNSPGGNNGKTKYKVSVKGQEDSEYSPDIDDGEREQEEAAKRMSEELKDNIRSIMNAAKDSNLTRGMEGGNILEFIKELTKVVIPWDELLEIAIKNHVVPSMENRSWKTPMKRFRSHGITIPGMGTDITASKMIVVIDTSGSIGSDDLAKFLSICNDSLIHFDEIIAIQHDHEIKKVTIVDKSNVETGLNDIAHFTGRGGTSHTEVFQYIEKKLWYEDNNVGLVIMLTDYYSDIDENWKSGEFNWVEEYPVKIVLNHNNVSIVPAYIDPMPIVIEKV